MIFFKTFLVPSFCLTFRHFLTLYQIQKDPYLYIGVIEDILERVKVSNKSDVQSKYSDPHDAPAVVLPPESPHVVDRILSASSGHHLVDMSEDWQTWAGRRQSQVLPVGEEVVGREDRQESGQEDQKHHPDGSGTDRDLEEQQQLYD